jgi:hypothetical protein
VIDELLRAASRLLKAILGGWIQLIRRQLRRKHRRDEARREDGWGRRGGSRTRCVPVPERTYRRPDPLIYSQGYLMQLGLAVTWDNPDITLFREGVAVPSHQLQPGTEYQVAARIWNGSTEAPAVGLPVAFSFVDFGIGGVEQPVGQTQVDLPVKGAPGHPAVATVPWRTPGAPGHYCLLVKLLWADDANPHNNVGQENTDVKAPSSPAEFRFVVRNDARRRRTLQLEADAYGLPERPPCPEPERPSKERDEPRRWHEEDAVRRRRRREREARLRELVNDHARTRFPVPEGWTVDIDQPQLVLDAGEEQEAVVAVQPPAGFSGRQPVNVNAFAGEDFVGGVTLVVEGSP